MNIAILTLSASDNCGSLLQAYALQQILIRLGYKTDILNFCTKRSKKMYRIFHPSYIKKPRKLLGLFLNYHDLKKQQNDYHDFRKNHLNMTLQKYCNSSDCGNSCTLLAGKTLCFKNEPDGGVIVMNERAG